MTRRSVINISVLIFTLTALLLAGFGCKGGSREAQEAAAKAVSLNWWRVGGSKQNFDILLNDYKKIRPNVSVNVSQIREEELESALIQALADGRAPDVVSLPNTWLRGWQHRLAPLPPTLTLPYLELTGTFKKEPRWVLKEINSLDLKSIKARYVDTVVNDVYFDSKIYGLPLNLDTLLIFYNVDLLTAAQFPEAPKTWNEFKEASQAITKLDKLGRLLQNGAALGTAENIPYSFDIVSALMLQNGTPMMTGGSASFQKPISVQGESYSPGLDALRFYTDFANASKETYSWSADQINAREAFAAGKLGFVFGYWRDLPNLKAMAPKIRIGLANFPQIEGSFQTSYYANYFIETVLKQSTHQTEAWDLIQFITTPAEAKKYLESAKQPTAQREFVTAQLADDDLGIPAAQVLTAKTWYRGYDFTSTQGVFQDMIKQVLVGTPIDQALSAAAERVTQTMRKP
ncbi:MAG: ABC transporter, solute-binding protein [Parcubacteria group bacterium GW2011_GWE1_43_8]|nr:MAG: ABC transporter, solute-binding protein [Parcubacteria group bacterium GW2011_GWE1_43_8]